MFHRLVLVVVAFAAAVATHGLTEAWTTAHEATTARGALQVGTNEPANITALLGVSRVDRVSYPGATYIAVQFEAFDLPANDYVIVRSPGGDLSYTYTSKGRGDTGSFYATFIPGSEAVIEYVARGSESDAIGYRVPAFARGFQQRRQIESVCGADQTVPAKCFARGGLFGEMLPLAYERSQPVARLLIGGRELCTGWLVGSQGHMMTNHHCITTAADALSIDIEFGGESASCADQCRTALGCRGSVVATSATFITNDDPLDYAIVRLPSTAPVATYGYLQLRATGPVVGEQIYIPQHPSGVAKRIAARVDGGALATILKVNTNGTPCGNNQVEYLADTEGGSSGSPVLSARDNAVVALHHCGGCNNLAVDVRDVIQDLKAKGIVIPNMIADGVTTPRPTTPTPPTPAPTTVTPAPTTPPPAAAGQCLGLSNVACDGVFFCTWNAVANQCQRWWN